MNPLQLEKNVSNCIVGAKFSQNETNSCLFVKQKEFINVFLVIDETSIIFLGSINW